MENLIQVYFTDFQKVCLEISLNTFLKDLNNKDFHTTKDFVVNFISKLKIAKDNYFDLSMNDLDRLYLSLYTVKVGKDFILFDSKVQQEILEIVKLVSDKIYN